MASATAGTIINRAAVQCGLASVADPYASTDPNFLQLQEYLTTVGVELFELHDWQGFVKEFTIVTAGSATSYPLPADFYDLTGGTGWNRSTRLPIIGPMTGQETQFLKARLSQVLVNVAFRQEGLNIIFPVAPADGYTIVQEYISRFWVTSAATGLTDSEQPVASGDTVLFDALLVIQGVKLKWLTAKGFDTAVAVDDFKRRLEHAIEKDTGARTLNLGGGQFGRDRMIDELNIPLTNFGL